jgi:hypothetical protein
MESPLFLFDLLTAHEPLTAIFSIFVFPKSLGEQGGIHGKRQFAALNYESHITNHLQASPPGTPIHSNTSRADALGAVLSTL